MTFLARIPQHLCGTKSFVLDNCTVMDLKMMVLHMVSSGFAVQSG